MAIVGNKTNKSLYIIYICLFVCFFFSSFSVSVLLVLLLLLLLRAQLCGLMPVDDDRLRRLCFTMRTQNTTNCDEIQTSPCLSLSHTRTHCRRVSISTTNSLFPVVVRRILYFTLFSSIISTRCVRYHSFRLVYIESLTGHLPKSILCLCRWHILSLFHIILIRLLIRI